MLQHTLLCVFFFLSCIFPTTISSSLFPPAASASSIWSNCNRQDISALLQFKDSFQKLDCSFWYDYDPFPYPKTSSWNVKNLTAQWNGVNCHRTTGRVIGLDLSRSCLHGSINSTSPLFQLHHLERLNLAYNNFSFSKIPSTLSNLSRLTLLNLSHAHFVGEIPLLEMSKLSKLSSLDLSDNSVLKVVDLKRLIQNLTNLEELDLSLLSIESNMPADDTFTNMSSLRSLKLERCDLHGEFPLGIFYLPNLRMLDMGSNPDLRGSLPDFHNSSNALESILLSDTKFSGKIPSSIGNLGSLRTLDLHNNQLFGEIPLGIMNLTQLTELRLGFNKLQGPINPTSFSSLKNLQVLGLDNNHLSGELDLGIFFQFKDLEMFVLSSNNLTVLLSGNNSSMKIDGAPSLTRLGLSSCRLTKFPEFLRDQHQLRYLDLSDNRIKGPIPKWMMNVSVHSLISLNVSHNLITNFKNTDDPHELLTYVLPWPNLMSLDISFNKIQGSVPVPPPPSLIYLASNNEFSGELSPLICALPSLNVLDLSSNHLTGKLPDCIGNFNENLTILKLRNNNFGGRIPQLCAANDGMGKTLEMIDLNGNNLEGKLPRSLSNCTKLEFLDLGNNSICGYFPSWLGSLQHLSIIDLNSNFLHGPLLGMSGSSSDHQLQFPKLRIINLSHNNLSEELPASFFQQWTAMKSTNLTNTRYMGPSIRIMLYSVTLNIKGIKLKYSNILDSLIDIDLSGNSFQGKIPVTLWSLRGLRFLNLSRNHLIGSIPSAIENLRQLESLDLSCNMFSERIPPQLKQLTFLSWFSVSHNNLNGQIPSGRQMDTFQNSSYIGNSGLCGPPLSRKCESSKHQKPQEPEKMAEKHDKFWKVVLIGFGGGLVVGVAVEYILDLSEPIMLFWRRRRRRQPQRNNN